MAKPYPPIRALVLRSLEDGQNTANQLRLQLTPDAENCMALARLLQTLVLAGLVRQLSIPRIKATDPMHAYALALPLKQALAADKAEWLRKEAESKAKRKAARVAKHGPCSPKPPKREKEAPESVPFGAKLSRIAGGGECVTIGNRRIIKLSESHRKIATDCIGNKVTGGQGFASCLMEVSI